MKPWFRKKKVWAAILGALLPVLTILLAPDDIETVKVVAAAIIEAGVAAGFIFAEASIDKADRKAPTKTVEHHHNHGAGEHADKTDTEAP